MKSQQKERHQSRVHSSGNDFMFPISILKWIMKMPCIHPRIHRLKGEKNLFPSFLGQYYCNKLYGYSNSRKKVKKKDYPSVFETTPISLWICHICNQIKLSQIPSLLSNDIMREKKRDLSCVPQWDDDHLSKSHGRRGDHLSMIWTLIRDSGVRFGF